MDENHKENSSTAEGDIQEKDYEDSKDSCEDSNVPKTSVSKLTVENLKRRPLHQEKRPLSKDTEEAEEKNKETEKNIVPTKFSESSLPSYIWYLLFFGLLIFVVLLYMWFPKSFVTNKQLSAKELVKDLKSRFHDLPDFTYRIIESAIRRAYSDEAEAPGIIVLLSSRKSKEITDKLASTLAEMLSDPLDAVLIDTKSPLPVERFKKEIDKSIQGNLTDKQMRAVLVQDLHQIPFDAAMIFHGYCDHENAPFKRVVYIMTAFVKENISFNSNCKQWDELASKALRAAWVGSGEDQVASLISRLTVSVAAVIPK